MSKAAELAALIGSQTALSNRNLIINGSQLVDQRNSGSSVTINSTNETYVTDRFICRGEGSDGVFTAEQDTTTPDDFKNSLKIAVTTADSSIGATQSYLIRHKIEGQNIAHLNWGSSSAKKCTLSFSVRSSVTGTFGGSFNNSAFDRSYPFTYTISAANTWERKEITVDGPTDGTFLTTNGAGIIIGWSLGAGSSRVGTADAWASANYQGATGQTNLIATNSSTLYITGVQLEVGEQATPFEHRSFGDELLKCYRYCYVWKAVQGYDSFTDMNVWNSTTMLGQYVLPVQMNHDPAIEVSAASDFVFSANSADRNITAMSLNRATPREVQILATDTDHGFGSGVGGFLRDDGNSNATVTLEAEL